MEKTIRNFNTGLPRNSSISTQSSVKQEFYEDVSESEITGLSLNPDSIARSLGVMTFILVFASTGALLADYLTGYNSLVIHKLVKFFYVDLELNAPAFFSMLLLLFASLLLTVITVFKKQQQASYLVEWAMLSVGFLFMAFDEIVAVHERLLEPMRAILGEQNLGIFYYAWVVPAIMLVFCLGIFFLRFLITLPSKTRTFFLISAVMYLGGAVGLELFEGLIAEKSGMGNLIYIILVTIEESLEMVGVIVFIWALLGYISDNYKDVEVRFDANHGHDQNSKKLYAPKNSFPENCPEVGRIAS